MFGLCERVIKKTSRNISSKPHHKMLRGNGKAFKKLRKM